MKRIITSVAFLFFLASQLCVAMDNNLNTAENRRDTYEDFRYIFNDIPLFGQSINEHNEEDLVESNNTLSTELARAWELIDKSDTEDKPVLDIETAEKTCDKSGPCIPTNFIEPTPVVQLNIQEQMKKGWDPYQLQFSFNCGVSKVDEWTALTARVAGYDAHSELINQGGTVKEYIEILKAPGVSPFFTPDEKMNQLCLAANKGQAHIVRFLLTGLTKLKSKSPMLHFKENFRVNRICNGGYTALYYAVQNLDLNMTKHLLSNGADPTVFEKPGRSALDLAQNNWDETAKEISIDLNNEIKKTLIKELKKAVENLETTRQSTLARESTSPSSQKTRKSAKHKKHRDSSKSPQKNGNGSPKTLASSSKLNKIIRQSILFNNEREDNKIVSLEDTKELFKSFDYAYTKLLNCLFDTDSIEYKEAEESFLALVDQAWKSTDMEFFQHVIDAIAPSFFSNFIYGTGKNFRNCHDDDKIKYARDLIGK